jgi:hypothetical protein
VSTEKFPYGHYGQLSKASTLLYRIFLFYRKPLPLPPESALSDTSYPASSGDNMLSNGTYLHANYNIHILMLSVLHTHLVCIELAGVFSSEYDTLLVGLRDFHKPSLRWRDIGKCIRLPLFSDSFLMTIINNYFHFKLFYYGSIPKGILDNISENFYYDPI